VALVPVTVVVIAYVFPAFSDQLYQREQARTKNLVEVSHSIVAQYGERFEAGQLSLEEAQAQALQQVGALRYGDGNYIWVNDLTPTMVMHPIHSDLDGAPLADYEDPTGKRFFVEMAETARASGGGFVDYLWPKPGTEKAIAKTSYVMLYEPWGWVLGSGFYDEDATAIVRSFQSQTLLWLVAALLAVLALSLVLSRQITRPLERLRAAAAAVASGDMNATVTSKGAAEVADLADSFNAMVRQLEKRAESAHAVINASVAVNLADDIEEGLEAMLSVAKASTEATYAALSVFDDEGAVETFLTLGMSEADQARIGHPPRGTGLLSYIHEHRETLRLDNMAEHPASVGFPDGHPTMKALLATPIVHGGVSLGNLYLADKTTGDGTFSPEDQEFIERLAELSAVSIASKKSATEKAQEQAYLEQQVQRAVAEMEAFADGDLTARLTPERDDAIARLFLAFNRAAETLSAMIARVGTAAEGAATTAAQIGASSDQLAAGAHEQSAQAEEVAAAVEEMVRTIVDTSANATRTAETAAKSGRTAEEGRAVVAETVQKIREIAGVVADGRTTVEQLGASSEEIGAIVETIEDIADQTNLLALNAAIEAARAGEHGRGFAVVADEVRKLAERTTHATAEISEMIAQIRRETGEAVGAMRRGSTEVEAGIALADRAGDSLAEIVAGADETRAMVTSIAAASEEQSTTSEQMARSVEMISSVSAEAAQGVGQIAEAAGGLSRLTEELRGLVGQFRTEGSRPQQHEAGGAPERSFGGDGHARMPAPPRTAGGCPFPHAS
jgi:methyl-accepting chemotaxis protein